MVLVEQGQECSGFAFTVVGIEWAVIFGDALPMPIGEVGIAEFLDLGPVEVDPALAAVAQGDLLQVAGVGGQAVGADQTTEAEQFIASAGVLREALLRQFVDFIFEVWITALVDFCAAFVVGGGAR